MSDSSLRLLIMLQQIPREPLCITTHELQSKLEAAGYPIGLRTIQRDLNTLSVNFPLIQIDTGNRNTGWAFAKNGRHTAFLGMDSVTALTVNMALEHLKNLVPAQVLDYLKPWQQEAEDKLSEQYKGWIKKVRVVNPQLLLPPNYDEKTLALVYQALLDGRQFKAEYNGKADMVVHPYGLIQKGQTLYLICRFFDFGDPRITALHRFNSAELLSEKVRQFKEFDIDNYIQEGSMQWIVSPGEIELKLEVEPYVANFLQETPISKQQKVITQQDSTIIVAKTADSMELRRWLLSQGSAIKLLEPEHLKHWLIDEARKILEQHEDLCSTSRGEVS